MTTRITGYEVNAQTDRVVIVFTLEGYRREDQLQIVNAAMDVAAPYLRQKGWIDAAEKIIVAGLHFEKVTKPEAGRTLTLGWHLLDHGPADCARCLQAKN